MEQAKAFSSTYADFESQYNLFTDSITDHLLHDGRVGWLFTRLLSRNVYQSKLFDHSLKIAHIRNLVDRRDFDHDVVVVDDHDLAKVLRNNFGSTIKVITRPGIRKYISYIVQRLHLLTVYKIVRLVYEVIIQLRLKSDRRRATLQGVQGMILLDTFFLANTKNTGNYVDRYYNGILESVPENIRQKIFFTPYLIGKYSNEELQNIINNSNEQFLFRHDFLDLADYYQALKQLHQLKLFGQDRFVFLGCNIFDLVKKTHREELTSTYQGILNYHFVRKLKQNNIDIELLIDWNENQSIDKGLVKGFKDYYPKIKVKGYQGVMVPRDYNFHLSPTPKEVDNGVIPHEICVTGKALTSEVDRNNSNIPISVAPAFRFVRTKSVKLKALSGRESQHIVVFLSIAYSDSFMLIDRIFKSIAKVESMRKKPIVIRPHPTQQHSIIKNYIQKKYSESSVIYSSKSMSYDMGRAILAIGLGTSALLECLFQGIPVIVVGNHRGITQNPIPKLVNRDLWDLCYSDSELIRALNKFIGLTFSERQQNLISAHKLMDTYIEKVNKDTVMEFLS
jgi:hypothetical protein